MFDLFICAYPTFEDWRLADLGLRHLELLYHQWFADQAHTCDFRNRDLLGRDGLLTVANENPYTFAYVQASLEAIAKDQTSYG
jgi:hypothetical protein